MAGADKSTKDKQMSSYLKEHGVTRTTMRCPMCHAVIGILAQYGHLSAHVGSSATGSRAA